MATVRRNLPINDRYQLIDSFYSELENGICCDNCGKNIANIGVIKNEDGKQFHVGMDCAETLTRLEGLNEATANFAEAKAIRAKLNKARKENKTINIENFYNGEILVQINNFTACWLKREFISKYLPELYKAIANPEKNNFIPIPLEDVSFNTFESKATPEAKQFYGEIKRAYEYKNFTVIIGLSEGRTLAGEPNGSKLFTIDVFVDRQLKASESTYMVRDINSKIYYAINKYLFENS